MEEAFNNSEKLIIPNNFRTSICWELFDKLTLQFSRFSEVLNLIKTELLSATYVNDGNFQSVINQGNVNSENLFELKTYYNELQRLFLERHNLKSERYIIYNFSDIWKLKLERLRSVLQRRQDKLRKAAMKWFNSLLYRCFNIWKERVSEKKKYRQKVMSVFAKWKVLFFL